LRAGDHTTRCANIQTTGLILDAAGLRADHREQRKWRGKLASKVMNPKERPVRAELLGRDGKIDGLQQHVRHRTRLGLK